MTALRLVWLVVGFLALALAVLGVFLPVLPTVPFLIVAAYAFARSSRRLYMRIMRDPVFGAQIRNWQRHGAIARRVKWIACLSMAGGVGVSLAIGLPLWFTIAQATVLVAVAAWIVTRPETTSRRVR